MQAVEELNIKTKNWKDLLTDEPFQRKDIITIQDPKNFDKFNLNSFHHLKNNLRIQDEGKLQTQLWSNHQNIGQRIWDIIFELNQSLRIVHFNK